MKAYPGVTALHPHQLQILCKIAVPPERNFVFDMCEKFVE